VTAIKKRFACFKDKDCQLAAALHPRFKLMRLQKHDQQMLGRVQGGHGGGWGSTSALVSLQVQATPAVASSRRHPGSLAEAGATCTKPTRATPSKLDSGGGTLLGEPVLAMPFVQYMIPVLSSAAPLRDSLVKVKTFSRREGLLVRWKFLTFLCSWGGIGIFGRNSRQMLTFLSDD
jgi:hypothetical protein